MPPHYDSGSGGLDDYGHSRRTSRAVTLIESPGFKISQLVLTAIVLPMIGWGMNSVVERLAKIESSTNQFVTQAATTELRLQTVEREGVREATELAAIRDKVSALDYAQRRLDERMSLPPYIQPSK
jgi:hypothetical protein